MKIDKKLRKYVGERLESLRRERDPWLNHWRELAEYILPRRIKTLISPGEKKRASQGMNKKIADPTGTIAAHICGAGMMSGVTSPARPWFRLRIGDWTSEGDGEVSAWLYDVESRMGFVLSQSNIYNCFASAHEDDVVFGTSVVFIDEDYEDVVRGFNPALGEFFLAVDDRNFPSTLYREFTMTVKAVVGRWKRENVPDMVKTLYDSGGANMDQELIVCHACERNDESEYGSGPSYVDKRFDFFSCYWLRSGPEDEALEVKGYYEQPFGVFRWSILSNDAYASSPGMDALPEIKQLQHETNRKGQAIDKMVAPPLVADVQLKNQPTSLLPGGVTYVSGASQIGVKPIFTVQPPIQEMMGDIQQIQKRIQSIFFNDIFMMISQLDTVRSATEIDARREEKLIMLGPVLDRLQNEALDPIIDRIFGVMLRAKLLPPAPQSIRGRNIQVQYVSMLAEAQSASKTIGIERLMGFIGTMAAGQPGAMDKFNGDEAIDEYARALRTSPKIIRDDEQVKALREQRQQEKQATDILTQTQAGANAAKTLSQAEVGGGQNALQQMVGG